VPPLLELSEVEARYGEFVALQDVYLVVPEGSVVALLGPNGMGKSTLLRTISGVLRPVRGEIRFDDRRIDGLPEHTIARLGLVHIPEGRGLFPGLTVRENLRMLSYVQRNGHDAALRRVFELFPSLESRMEQTAGTLSGGEQQMLSLAAALLMQPRLLMVDELSLGLGPRIVQELFETVRRIRDEGTTILLVEQYVAHALRLADIVVILHKGRVEFVGEPGELAQNERLVEAYLGVAGTESYAVTEKAARPSRRRAASNAPRGRARRRRRPSTAANGEPPRP
jgi:branched-chain amino acid transport system ATP-binding protein